MVVMALDHMRLFLVPHPMESWESALPQYDSARQFLSRFATHICAPGFFLLMGSAGNWFVAYSLFGWLGVAFLGMAFGRTFLRYGNKVWGGCYGWNMGLSRIVARQSSRDRSWKSSIHWPV